MSPLRIALFASLGLNLFIGGWWVGDVVRRAPGMQPPPFMGGNGGGPPPTAIAPTLEAIDRIIRNGMTERIALLGQLHAAAIAEPYDAAAMRTLLDSLLDLRRRVDAEHWSAVADSLPILNQADRTALADFVFNPNPGPAGNPAPMANPGGPGGPANPAMFNGPPPPPQ